MNRDNFFKTNLKGRLKKIKLSSNDCFLPIFECVVNSIQSIEERALSDKNFSIKDGKIDIEFVYDDKQIGKDWSETPITGFKVSDNGAVLIVKIMIHLKLLIVTIKRKKAARV